MQVFAWTPSIIVMELKTCFAKIGDRQLLPILGHAQCKPKVPWNIRMFLFTLCLNIALWVQLSLKSYYNKKKAYHASWWRHKLIHIYCWAKRRDAFYRPSIFSELSIEAQMSDVKDWCQYDFDVIMISSSSISNNRLWCNSYTG